ncbi:MAG: carboxylesterase [Tenericutes bacterium HGW-Tenericutes-3]|nr:MAG: carboxylesterase [Tenericutes bacterium HGW-Tenericutes-3]
MKHIYIKGTKEVTLLMLHGTGGDEKSLLPIAKQIDPDANVLSVRGNVLEYGMPRFYKRKAMDVFDRESIIEETHNLCDFVRGASVTYKFNCKKVVAVGYAGGANIAISVLFHYEQAFYKAILLHPMVPLRNVDLADLRGTKIFIGAGRNDRMMPDHEVEELTQMLQSANASVEVFWTNYGHQLSKEEIHAAKDWYDGKKTQIDFDD